MRLRYCPFDDLTMRSPDGLGERLGRGAAVDFDRVIGHGPDGKAVTVEEALGEYAAEFSDRPLTPDIPEPSAPSPSQPPAVKASAAPVKAAVTRPAAQE